MKTSICPSGGSGLPTNVVICTVSTFSTDSLSCALLAESINIALLDQIVSQVSSAAFRAADSRAAFEAGRVAAAAPRRERCGHFSISKFICIRACAMRVLFTCIAYVKNPTALRDPAYTRINIERGAGGDPFYFHMTAGVGQPCLFGCVAIKRAQAAL
ncbi:hypothetical protein EVAR_82353_1 [Eumeta japonica]|uniref:Uncharacterized protein n=1 Tax=Eumeta variegata TaxID=151549 RepID=A0A4C1UA46_EUMVA|nr:hypothetical protein EVAR_82353_1 [Eumeta japonica]